MVINFIFPLVSFLVHFIDLRPKRKIPNSLQILKVTSLPVKSSERRIRWKSTET